MARPESKYVYDYDAPSSEMIAERLIAKRNEMEMTQVEAARRTSMSRSAIARFESASLDPIGFFFGALKLYGLEDTVKIYGIDWRYYTSERLRVYCAYYGITRATLAREWDMSYTNMRFCADDTKKTKILNRYKTKIDETFPDIVKDGLMDYYCIGKNSLCRVCGNHTFIFRDGGFRENDKSRENSMESLMKEAEILLENHSIEKRYL